MACRRLCYNEEYSSDEDPRVKRQRLRGCVISADPVAEVMVKTLAERTKVLQNAIDSREKIIIRLKEQLRRRDRHVPDEALEARVIELHEDQSRQQHKIDELKAQIPNIHAIIREVRAESGDDVETRVIARLKRAFDKQVEEVKAALAPHAPTGSLCVVCQDEPPRCIIMPCKHLCVCKECSVEIRRAGISKCPVCRIAIVNIIEDVFLP